MSDYSIQIKASLNEAQSSESINTSLQNIQSQITATIGNITLSDAAISSLQGQISQALGNVTANITPSGGANPSSPAGTAPVPTAADATALTALSNVDANWGDIQKARLEIQSIKNDAAMSVPAVQELKQEYIDTIDAVQAGEAPISEATLAHLKMNTAITQENEAMRTTSNSTDSFSDVIEHNIQKVAQWAIAKVFFYPWHSE